MGDVRVDLFAEDDAHEQFVRALLERIGFEEGIDLTLSVRSARGGSARVLSELRAFQRGLVAGAIPSAMPDVLVVVIDANDRGWVGRRRETEAAINQGAVARSVVGCPDPYVEAWFLADPLSFEVVVGAAPRPSIRPRDRNEPKRRLAQAVADGTVISVAGGIDLAPDLVAAMDLFRAGKGEPSLGDFVDALRGALRDASRV